MEIDSGEVGAYRKTKEGAADSLAEPKEFVLGAQERP